MAVGVKQTCGLTVDTTPAAYTHNDATVGDPHPLIVDPPVVIGDPVVTDPPVDAEPPVDIGDPLVNDGPDDDLIDGVGTIQPVVARSFEAQTSAEEPAPTPTGYLGVTAVFAGLLALGAAAFHRRKGDAV